MEIASVETFYGWEKDYIIISIVWYNEDDKAGLLCDYWKFNVTITRAKYGLIICGNAKLLKSDFWVSYVQYLTEGGMLVEGSIGNLKQVKLTVKKTLEEVKD